MRSRITSPWTAFLFLLVTAVLLPPCEAQVRARAASQKNKETVTVGPKDRAELEAFIDGVVAAQMEARHLVGVTISVVAGGEVLLAKGYGYANLRERQKVDASRTLFRIGSVSKLFTWAAVMQLVEEGKLNLDADVNEYLAKFQIPDTYAEPITMSHLMAHTPGFEDHVIGLFARGPGQLRPLDELLSREMPRRVRPPGQFAAYSNYGSALAGHIVEQLSGMSWESCIETRILEPLGMTQTTVRQPVPESLNPDLAAGYEWVQDEHRERPFEFIPMKPAGSISASAADMARFMLAFLGGGSLEDSRILSEETVGRMQTPLFSQSPHLNSMLHGFYEMSSNGQRIIGHGGDTFWFHSQLLLIPEQGTGLFVSYNSDSASAARSELVRAFLDHYYPVPEPPEVAPTPESRRRAERMEGHYGSMRLSSSTPAKMAILMNSVQVRSTDRGYLTTSGAGPTRRWAEVEPRVYRRVGHQEMLVFQEDDQGRITHMFLGNIPMISFARLHFAESPVFHLSILGVSAFFLLSALIAWPIGAFRHRHDSRSGTPSRMARLLAWIAAALDLAFLVGLVVALQNPLEIAFGVPPLVRYLIPLPLAAILFLFGAVIFTVLAWTRGYWSFFSRAYFTLVTLAGLALLWWFHYWNLLGYHFGGWAPV